MKLLSLEPETVFDGRGEGSSAHAAQAAYDAGYQFFVYADEVFFIHWWPKPSRFPSWLKPACLPTWEFTRLDIEPEDVAKLIVEDEDNDGDV